jgi:hypothetical protein
VVLPRGYRGFIVTAENSSGDEGDRRREETGEGVQVDLTAVADGCRQENLTWVGANRRLREESMGKN